MLYLKQLFSKLQGGKEITKIYLSVSNCSRTTGCAVSVGDSVPPRHALQSEAKAHQPNGEER